MQKLRGQLIVDSELKNDLDAHRRGELSEEARNRLAKRLYEEAIAIARAQQRRRGSPDGLAGASDVANSRVAAIMIDPIRELGSIETTDELQQALYRMLIDGWIKRRRQAKAKKRGGHMKRVTDAATDDSSGQAEDDLYVDITPLTPAEMKYETKELLSIFPDSSEYRAIVCDLIEGWTQTEIGERLGLSRESVGRRIRDKIGPQLRLYLQDRVFDESDVP